MIYRAKFRPALLSATVLTAAAFATHASAQDEVTAASAGEASAATSEGDAIIVTGTRRATTIMDTPINISAIGGEMLEDQRISDVRDLADFTPGMTVSDTGPGTTGAIVLRGLNASDVQSDGSNYDDSLGVYLGEVPLYYDFKLLDLERVETLLGPQGTLYGLGTLAGAIRYIPVRPDVTAVEGEVYGRVFAKSHSDDQGYQASAVINVPLLADHIAFRSVLGYYNDPGFIDYTLLLQEPSVSLPQPDGPDTITDAGYAANLYEREDLNYERTLTTRNQLLFQTSEDLKLILTYAYQETDTGGAQSNSFGVFGTGRYENASRYAEPSKRRAHLASAEINANIADFVDLVATGAYTDVRVRTIGDVTDLLLDLDYDYELFPAFSGWNELDNNRDQINGEVRLVSRHGGPFSWVLGGFYNEQELQSDYAEHLPGIISVYGIYGNVIADNPDEIEYASYVTSKVTEKAIFGEGTFQVTPEWQVTAGARYFDYSSEIAGAATLPLLNVFFSQPLSPYDLDPAGGDAGQDGWVWKFNTSYDITPDVMVYGTYSKGYRIGGPNRVAPCPQPLPNDPDGDNVNNTQLICALPWELQYGPDKTKNIDIGVRAQLFDRMLSVNFSVFQIKWDGIQVDSATLNGITGITVNGGSAKSEGVEFSFNLQPIPELAIHGTYSYVDARLTEDVPGIITYNEPPGTYPSAPVQIAALDGDRLPGSAKNSGSLGVTYTTPIMDGDLIANWTVTYRGDVVSRLGWDRAFGTVIPSYVLNRASLSYETGDYTLTLFADNIFDEYAVVSVGQDRSRIGVNDGVRLRYYRQTVISPRTVGIESRFKF